MLFAPGSSLGGASRRLPSGKRTAISPSRNSHARTMKSTRAKLDGECGGV